MAINLTIDDYLSRENYVEFWQDFARKSLKSNKCRSDFLPEAIGILQGAFGRDWLEFAAKNAARNDRLNSTKVHPLGKCLGIPSTSTISEILEVALLLRELHGTPGLDKVVRDLKQPSTYPSSFLQLSLGFRFRQAGACDLIFEPSVQGGRFADVAFIFNHRRFVIECYVPRYAGHPRELVELRSLLSKVDLSKLGLAVPLVRVHIRDPSDFSPTDRKTIRTYLDSLKALPASRVEFEASFVELFDAKGRDESWVQEAITLSPGEAVISTTIERLRPTSAPLTTSDSYPIHRALVVTGPSADFSPEEMSRDLAKKLESKTGQLKTPDDSVGIFASMTWIGQPHLLREESTEHLRNKVLIPHGVSAGLLITRQHRNPIDVCFCGTIVLGARGHEPLVEPLLRAYEQREKDWIVTDSW